MNTENPTLSPPIQKQSTNLIWATGRRKTAIARIRFVPTHNNGKLLINGQSIEEYFKGNWRQAQLATQSYNAIKGFSGYHIFVTVHGGGLTGQAEAIRHGIARGLAQLSDKDKIQMRKLGFLTRDPRAVERKKSGQPKARKRFQYSKR
jgi:small subunit ribosomal protein S9